MTEHEKQPYISVKGFDIWGLTEMIHTMLFMQPAKKMPLAVKIYILCRDGRLKNLILICGANGIGKSTACKTLVGNLSNSAFIDSDYCRYMNPFNFSDEEIQVVISNISSMMINYFKCSTIKNVIFQYGFHGIRAQIFSAILNTLSSQNIEYHFCPIILQCELDENIRRMKKDNRDEDRIKRAVEKTRNIYDEYDYPKIDVTSLSIHETAEKIIDLLINKYLVM